MRISHVLLALPLLGSFAWADDPSPAKPKARTQSNAAPDTDSVQDVIFLGENRPIFLRLRITLGEKPLRAAWTDSVKTLHAFLDRNGDGIVSKDEAEKTALSTLVRIANGTATAMPRTDLDNHPKDGVVSIEELSDGLRTALGPFRVEVGKLAGGKTDALFDQLDRDKDGNLTKAELASASGSLQQLDLDDDELIDAAELEPFSNPMAMGNDEVPGRRARLAPVPPVLDLTPDDTTLRPVRLLIKRYDKGNGSGATPGDNKLSHGEFAIDAKAFSLADADSDGALDTEELRRFLAKVTPDLTLDVHLSGDSSGAASVKVVGAGDTASPLPRGVQVKTLDGGDVEIAIDEVRLEVHVDDGARASADTKRAFMSQFEAADADNNGYLEESELTKDKDHPSPLASLFKLLDRDKDGKLYPKEMDAFIDAQIDAAKSRTVLTTSDQGRAIFAILDLNRDRRLGVRELRGTVARVASWDRDGDGKITSDEIPHHYQLTLGRGSLAGLGFAVPMAVAGPMAAPAPVPAGSGPSWFRKMDRNRDGDISRREFHGNRAQFSRLDRDKDDLIDPSEAASATPATASSRPNAAVPATTVASPGGK
ncbi:MAG: hypothetical protein JWN86_1591 [Planctomycetota bacterium]|nr:hypothetical protein [Planctomycetota bacterium]